MMTGPFAESSSSIQVAKLFVVTAEPIKSRANSWPFRSHLTNALKKNRVHTQLKLDSEAPLRFPEEEEEEQEEEIEASARMAMAVQQGSRQQQHDGVKVKFIETQFISSDAASFKAVVQRLTGKSPSTPAASHAPAPAPPQRPRPCRPSPFAGADAAPPQHQQAGHGHHFTMPAPKQEPQQRLEELYDLCDFGDLLYATSAGSRRDGFPY
ncbi:hypothetical protein EJB05_42128, partial [Eragrostis curvula]